MAIIYPTTEIKSIHKRNYWTEPANQHRFMEQLTKKLGLKTLDDWHNVEVRTVEKHGGAALLRANNHSLYRGTKLISITNRLVLQLVYPNHDWKPWMFTRSPTHFWNDIKNQRRFCDHITAELKMNDLNDWYKVSIADVVNRGGAGFLKLYNGSLIRGIDVLINVHFVTGLQAVYPEHPWKPWSFHKPHQGIESSLMKLRSADFITSLQSISAYIHDYGGSRIRF